MIVGIEKQNIETTIVSRNFEIFHEQKVAFQNVVHLNDVGNELNQIHLEMKNIRKRSRGCNTKRD
jgi:hypothetical protein